MAVKSPAGGCATTSNGPDSLQTCWEIKSFASFPLKVPVCSSRRNDCSNQCLPTVEHSKLVPIDPLLPSPAPELLPPPMPQTDLPSTFAVPCSPVSRHQKGEPVTRQFSL